MRKRLIFHSSASLLFNSLPHAWVAFSTKVKIFGPKQRTTKARLRDS